MNEREAVMRGMKTLGGLILLACAASVIAADKQVVAQNDVVVAKKQAAPAAKPVVAKAKADDKGDSRMNDYALERSSCCGPN